MTTTALNIGVLMDPIETIKPYKDSTFAMMLSAQARGHTLHYFQQRDIYVDQGAAYVTAQRIRVEDNNDNFYQVDAPTTFLLETLDVILMRKDPPFDMEYIYTTYMLEMAEQKGTLIVNPPHALRAVNEKFSIANFPALAPKTLISRDMDKIKALIAREGSAVVKPMDGMGGSGIFKMRRDDTNTSAILEALGNGANTLMVQAYLDQVSDGDKRILLVDGQAPEYGLARIPQGSDFRANLAAGGKGVVQALTDSERALCEGVKPWVKEMGLLFVGLDVIGGKITEINVTSPTCIREIEAETDERIAERLIVAIENRKAN